MDAAAVTVYRGHRECGRSALPPSTRAVGRQRGCCLCGGAIVSLSLSGRPLPRLARGTRATRRMLMRDSHRVSPQTSTEGYPRPHRPLRTCFLNFPSCPSLLQNFCGGCSGWNLCLACSLRHTNMRACTGRALKISALVQLG